MEYMVTAADGKEYGPASIDQLKQWIAEDRLRPDSMLRDFHTSQRLRAGDVPGLFSGAVPPQAGGWSQPPSPYPRQTTVAYQSSAVGNNALWGSIIRSILAVVFFFVVHGLGIFFAAYAVYYGFQARAHGNKYGNLALGISLVALAAVIVGWCLRLSSGAV